MDKLKKETDEEFCTRHRRQIIVMVMKIENPWILKQILQFIVNMTKED